MASPVAVLACAVLAVTPGPGGCEILEEPVASATELPPADQRRLPSRLSLANLCPSASSSPRLERRLRRQAAVLVAEVERRPDRLVDYTVYDSHTAEPTKTQISVEELAEQRLHELEVANSHGVERCAPRVQRRLEAALR